MKRPIFAATLALIFGPSLAALAEEPGSGAALPERTDAASTPADRHAPTAGARFEIPASVHPIAPDERILVRSVSFDRLGLDRARLDELAFGSLAVPIHGRADRVLAGLAVHLVLDPSALARAHVQAVELHLGGAVAARIDAASLTRGTTRPSAEPGPLADGGARPPLRVVHRTGGAVEVVAELDRRLASTETELELVLIPEGAPAPCARVPRGTWRFLRSGALEVSERPLPIEPSLSRLPLPFFDPRVEEDRELEVVFLAPPTTATLRAAGLVAGALGRLEGHSGQLRFRVKIGEVPEDETALVVVVSPPSERAPATPGHAALARAVDLAPPGVTLLAPPGHPDSASRLLVVHAPDAAGLERAALHFATTTALPDSAELPGPATPELHLDERPPLRRPNDAPRWVSTRQPVPLAALEGGDALVADGAGPRTLAVYFRTAPDLFVWPEDHLALDLEWTTTIEPGQPAPVITVDLDGHFVERLPAPPADAHGHATHRVWLPRGLVRGSNVLHFYVEPAESPDVCERAAGEARVEIAGTSTLRFDLAGHFAPAPDLGAFVSDGHPFTRLADLSDTAIVVPDAITAEPAATVLSFLAHAARITGVAPTRFALLTARQAAAQPTLDADLFAAGTPGELAALFEGPGAGPLDPTAPRLELRAPTFGEQLLDLARGGQAYRERARASELLATGLVSSAAVAFESPRAPGRTAVVLTSDRRASLPQVAELEGPFESTRPRGDLLLLRGDTRTLVAVGPEWTERGARSSRLVRARWWLAEHGLALAPTFLLGALFFSGSASRLLQRRAAERLDTAPRPKSGAERERSAP